jgi:hypothetical protein
VLRSPRFHREISSLLFFFAALSAIYFVLLFAAGTVEEEALALAIANLVTTIGYVVLAILIRRGSVKALVFTGILFAVNLVMILFGPSWEGVPGAIVGYGLLTFVLIRYVRRERRRVDVHKEELPGGDEV